MTAAEPGGIGHNRPPVDEGLSVSDALARADELVKHANRWRAERPKITDQEMAAAAARYITQLRQSKDTLKLVRERACAPHNDAIAVIVAQFVDPMALLDIALNGMVMLNTEYLQTEQDRLDAERRKLIDEASAAEAEARKAEYTAALPGATVESVLAAEKARNLADRLAKKAGKPAPKAQVRDNIGGAPTMSLHSRWTAEITDFDAALADYLKMPGFRLAVLNLLTAQARRDVRLSNDPATARKGVRYFKQVGKAQ